MALVNIESDKDPWILEYDSCERLQRDLMELFNLRNREKRNSSEHARISVSIRLRIKQYNNEVEQLKQKNERSIQTSSITSEEYERRTRQIELLQSKGIRMNSLFEEQNKSGDRRQLFNQSAGSSGIRELETVDWGVDVDIPPISSTTALNPTVDDLRRNREQMLEDQDKGLEALSKIISKQKNIAETINTEVDLHNEIIDNLAENMDRTHGRIRNETQNIHIVTRKDATCGYWFIIISLFVCILIVGFI